jgi:Tfp pilus assembly PilM family ATPase
MELFKKSKPKTTKQLEEEWKKSFKLKKESDYRAKLQSEIAENRSKAGGGFFSHLEKLQDTVGKIQEGAAKLNAYAPDFEEMAYGKKRKR